MKLKVIAVILLTTVVLGACNGESSNDDNSRIDMEMQNIKELVNEYSGDKTKDESASITSNQLILTDKEGNESAYALPEEEFFVSVAPYINETHPCTNHSLTGCQGELANKDVAVYIEDSKGNVLVDETMKTLANGFIDLWLPRDQTYNIKMEHKGKTVKSSFSTYESDGTCITTMQLK
ncbi:CueP family metal-binding protein [Lysinibacillus fusiformis]|uniref:CueP family metal-binding protein n=1 Tax=Lysinibacillus fusiformis TaxID=28031 RepID=UPI00177E8CA3|nr:CueP family metal-binding protein [Lysinibacillus fusiformis]